MRALLDRPRAADEISAVVRDLQAHGAGWLIDRAATASSRALAELTDAQQAAVERTQAAVRQLFRREGISSQQQPGFAGDRRKDAEYVGSYLDDLYEGAAEAQPVITEVAEELAERYGGRAFPRPAC